MAVRKHALCVFKAHARYCRRVSMRTGATVTCSSARRLATETLTTNNNLGVDVAFTGLCLSPEHTMPHNTAHAVLLVQADANSREAYAEVLRYQESLPVLESHAVNAKTS